MQMNINKPTQFGPGEGRASEYSEPTWSNTLQQLPHDIFDILELPSNIANKIGVIPDSLYKRTVGNAHDAIDDLISGEAIKGKQGSRNLLQELLFSPWIADTYKKTVKEPWLNDMIAPHINPGFKELLGGIFANPQDTTIGQGDFDLSKDIELQQMYLNQRK